MEEVYEFIGKKLKLTETDTVVIGVSGGPDSMALLYIMNQFKEKIGSKIICAHVNHNKRPESVELLVKDGERIVQRQVVKAEDGSSKTYTIVVNRNDNRNGDSTLRSLSVSSGSIKFSASVKSYNVSLNANVESFSVEGVANNSKSKVSYSPSKSINILTIFFANFLFFIINI